MPCVKGCPVGINIPSFIKQIKENNIDAAYKIITEQNSFPRIYGRVCPKKINVKLFVLGNKGEVVTIGRLERFVSDNVKDKAIENRKLNMKK